MITNLRDDKMVINQAKVEIEVLQAQKVHLMDKLTGCRMEKLKQAAESAKMIAEATERNFDLKKENDRLISLLHSKTHKKVSFWSKLFG